MASPRKTQGLAAHTESITPGCVTVSEGLCVRDKCLKRSDTKYTHTLGTRRCVCVQRVFVGPAGGTWSWAHSVPLEALIARGGQLGGGYGGLAGYGPRWVEPSPALVCPWWEQPGEYMGSWSAPATVHAPDKGSDSIVRLHLWPRAM